MQLVLGVSVAGASARLALIDVSSPDGVLDQFDIDLATAPADTLRSTIVGTDSSFRDSGHRLAATRIAWSDEGQAAELRDALTDAGLSNVGVVAPADAATAVVRASASGAGQQTSALMFVDTDTAALSVVGADAANTSVIAAEPVGPAGPEAACTELLDRLRDETGGAESLYVVGTGAGVSALTEVLRATSPIPVRPVEAAAFAIARGAALANLPAPSAPELPSLDVSTTPGPQIGEHLAYSMDPDSGAFDAGYGPYGNDVPMQAPMAPLSHADDPDEFDEEPAVAAAPGRPRILLVGSTIAAIVVVGFATLAVVVAISIQPAAVQQAIRDYEAVPGKYLPVMPGQGTTAVEDSEVYLPPVVPVVDKPADEGGRTVLAGGNRGNRYSTSAGSGGGGVETRTVFVAPSGPGGGGGAVVAPPRFGFNLGDVLPDGIVVDLDVFSPEVHRCGTIECFRKSLDPPCPDGASTLACVLKVPRVVCTPEDTSPRCLRVLKEPVIGGGEGETEQLDQTITSGCPGASCGADPTEGITEDPGLRGTEATVGADTEPDESKPRTPFSRSDDENPDTGLTPPSAPGADEPSDAPAQTPPVESSTPADEPTRTRPRDRQPVEAPAAESPVGVPAPAPVEAPAPEPAVEAPAPRNVEAPAPPPVVVEAPAPPPVVVEAPA
ncbi:MAG: hypothetical protein U1D00_28910, partial [Mycobacterium sp.]|nr:hypothetical protein [Mycobacterium sp.]